MKEFVYQSGSSFEGEIQDIPIWRYMDLTKFISILDKNALFFTRADKLGDPFEGSSTEAILKSRSKSEIHSQKTGKRLPIKSISKNVIKSKILNTIVSCWHMNKSESAAMWRLYLASNEGIAIKSTYSRFIKSFPKKFVSGEKFNEDGSDRHFYIYITRVKYIDFNSYHQKSHLNLFALKRKSFQHEQELRAIVQDHSWQGDRLLFPEDDPRYSAFLLGGEYIRINMKQLIEAVYVSPTAPSWFTDVVTSVIKKYGFKFPVIQSDLSKNPVY